MAEKILTVSDLQVAYKERSRNPFAIGKKSDIEIVRDVSFSMEKGEILGLVGESGSGKSTLAKAVLGMIPSKGSIEHFSKSPQMIFQDPYSSLNPVKKIGWILEEPLRLQGGYSKEERKEKVISLLNEVGMDEKYRERYPSQLSGGQRQRVCIAAALMQEPELLVADEAVSALDVTIQMQILELFKKFHEERKLSVLFISHDLRVVYQMCDRVMIMQRGRIVESGVTEEVYFSHKNEYTGKLLKAAGIV